MANTRISTAAAQAALDAITVLLDGGSIEIRTGAPPATLETGATGTLLGTLALNADSFSPAVDGTDKATATANAIVGDADADAAGIAGWFRAFSSGAAAVIQGDITAVAGGGDMEIDNTNIQAGDTINVTSWNLNMPEA